MQYKRVDKKIVVRLERGEEILTSLTELAKKEKIRAASLVGIGALTFAEYGVFLSDIKEYKKESYEGAMEILSLNGNFSTKDGEPYLHLHITLSGSEYKVFGGHLNKGIIGPTGEFFIDLLDCEQDRFFSEDVGINLLDLSK